MDVLEDQFRFIFYEEMPPPDATIAMRPTGGNHWHTDRDCPRLVRTNAVRIYPLEIAVRLSALYAMPCGYCVPPRDDLLEVLREHEPAIRLLDDFVRG